MVDAEGDLGLGVFDLFERVFGLFLIVYVEFHETLAGRGEGVEVGWEENAGEFALEVGGVACAVIADGFPTGIRPNLKLWQR